MVTKKILGKIESTQVFRIFKITILKLVTRFSKSTLTEEMMNGNSDFFP